MSSSIDLFESEARYYSRVWPTTFTRAQGSFLWNRAGDRYIDFFAGAGARNYGHNPEAIQQELLQHIGSNEIIHAFDMWTDIRKRFLVAFNELILRPRNLAFQVLFPGPAGTNTIEAALKFSRCKTRRTQVAYIDGAYHGMALSSLVCTTSTLARSGAGVVLRDSVQLPHHLDKEALDPVMSESIAAVVLETTQIEASVRTIQPEWLHLIAQRSREHGAALIIDEVQTDCGRIGPFFSFERLGLIPDLVCLSKSLSGYGPPLSAVLVQKDWDRTT